MGLPNRSGNRFANRSQYRSANCRKSLVNGVSGNSSSCLIAALTWLSFSGAWYFRALTTSATSARSS